MNDVLNFCWRSVINSSFTHSAIFICYWCDMWNIEVLKMYFGVSGSFFNFKSVSFRMIECKCIICILNFFYHVFGSWSRTKTLKFFENFFAGVKKKKVYWSFRGIQILSLKEKVFEIFVSFFSSWKVKKIKITLWFNLKRYKLGLDWLLSRNPETVQEDETKKRDLVALLLTNMAIVNLKAQYPKGAKKFAVEAVKYADSSDRKVKALYNAARACRVLNEFEEALGHVREGLRVKRERALVDEHALILEKLKVAKMDEKVTCRKMFSSGALDSGEKEGEGKSDEVRPDTCSHKFWNWITKWTNENRACENENSSFKINV